VHLTCLSNVARATAFMNALERRLSATTIVLVQKQSQNLSAPDPSGARILSAVRTRRRNRTRLDLTQQKHLTITIGAGKADKKDTEQMY